MKHDEALSLQKDESLVCTMSVCGTPQCPGVHGVRGEEGGKGSLIIRVWPGTNHRANGKTKQGRCMFGKVLGGEKNSEGRAKQAGKLREGAEGGGGVRMVCSSHEE